MSQAASVASETMSAGPWVEVLDSAMGLSDVVPEEKYGDGGDPEKMKQLEDMKQLELEANTHTERLGGKGVEMIEAAKNARVDHLTKLSETGVCGRPDGKHMDDATLQFLSDLTPDGKNKELFLCRRCGFVAPNHLWHQEKGQYGMKHHLRCSRCNTEYSSWMRDGRFCMRL